MPRITIEMFSGRTTEQKAKLAAAITKAVVEIAKAPTEKVQVVYRDLSKEDVFNGGDASK